MFDSYGRQASSVASLKPTAEAMICGVLETMDHWTL
jgi:hypothetical protein